MYYKLFSGTIIAALAFGSMLGTGYADSGVVRDGTVAKIKSGNLDKTTLTSGSLRIRIIKFRGSVLKIGIGYLGVEVHNASDQFAPYSPSRLSFLNKDFTQVDMLASIFGGDKLVALRDRRLAPRATIDEYYQLDQKVELPCRLYYEEKLLAEIVD
jgi:hypothetical protein